MLNLAEDALNKLEEFGDELLPVLIDALDDPDEAHRHLVLEIFGELGNKAESALPVMINSLEDDNRVNRLSAAGVVARFGKKAKAANPILESWIGSEDRFSHLRALGSILKIDPTRAVELLPVLIDALENEDGLIKFESIGMLGSLGELAEDAIPALKLLLNCDSTLSMAASDAIYKITGDPSDVITVGLQLLDEKEWLQRYVGAEHLQALGTKARVAITRLRKALHDENESVRSVVRRALYEIGGDD